MRILTALTATIGCLAVLAAAPAPAPASQESAQLLLVGNLERELSLTQKYPLPEPGGHAAAEYHCIEECLSVEEDCLLNSISMTECVNQYDSCHTSCLPNRAPPQYQAPPPPPPPPQHEAPPATPSPALAPAPQTDKNDKNKNVEIELILPYEDDVDEGESAPVLSGDDGDEQDDDGGY
ncbi:hypothetical protein BG006_006031 [Podila minutissima]|uniref:Uncharacterized protein n=1 Tax=Podila minutissima TaxID=64525 RepID=A0A9P5VQN1_9FUNG|nr:hypothetical protein BG006_006031 [Podila minutissima]